MVQRCTNPKNTSYSRYGGRGIGVCDEWRLSYVAFRDWGLANGYADNLTLDREENDDGYSPANCRWIDTKMQASNTSRSCMMTVGTKTMNVLEWSRETGIGFSTLYQRYRKGLTGDAFIAKPMKWDFTQTPARRYRPK